MSMLLFNSESVALVVRKYPEVEFYLSIAISYL